MKQNDYWKNHITVEKTLKQRGSIYGEFADNAEISQILKQTMRNAKNWDELSYAQQEALEMVQHKISRLLNGDPTYLDNVVDILGYTELMFNDMKVKSHGKKN
jgi:hypothetical protein